MENKKLTSFENMVLVKKDYVLVLQKRLYFIRKGWVLLSEQDKNKIEVEEYEIAEKIKKELFKIKQIEIAFEKEFNHFSVDLNWLTDNQSILLEKAKKNQNHNFAIKHLLYAINWKLLDENIVEKIKFYKELDLIINT
jgi:hypothetical protein